MGPKTTAELVKSLREGLGQDQKQIAERSRGYITQDKVAKIESGENKGTVYKTRLGLAHGLGLTMTELDAYLSGETSLVDVVLLAQGRIVAADQGRGAQDVDPLHVDDDASEFEVALGHAWDPTRYTLRDFDNARRAIRETQRLVHDGVDLVEVARAWLEAARQLRTESVEVTTLAVVTRVAVSKLPRAQAVAEARDDQANADLDARLRDAGLEPGSRRAALDKLRKK